MIYCANHYVGYQMPLKWLEQRVTNIPKMRETVVDFGMHAVILLHSILTVKNEVRLDRLMTQDVSYCQWIQSHYALETAYYILDMLVQQLNPLHPMRADFFIHHIISFILLYLSYITGFVQIGAFTMLLLNSTNVSLDMCIIGHITNKPLFEWATSVMLMAIFGYVRVGLMWKHFVLNVMYTCLFSKEPVQLSSLQRGVFVGMTSMLYGLQCIWMWKIMRIVWKNTKQVIREPYITPYVPVCFLKKVDPIAYAVQRYTENSMYDLPPMDQDFVEFMEKMNDWESNVQKLLASEGLSHNIETLNHKDTDTDKDKELTEFINKEELLKSYPVMEDIDSDIHVNDEMELDKEIGLTAEQKQKLILNLDGIRIPDVEGEAGGEAEEDVENVNQVEIEQVETIHEDVSSTTETEGTEETEGSTPGHGQKPTNLEMFLPVIKELDNVSNMFRCEKSKKRHKGKEKEKEKDKDL